MAFSGPFTAYKLNHSCYYFRYYFCRCFSPYTAYINPAATTRIDPAAIICINLAITFYCPPYCQAARLWSYYYPPYKAARFWFYKCHLQLLYSSILD
jgi:hypothetical protein